LIFRTPSDKEESGAGMEIFSASRFAEGDEPPLWARLTFHGAARFGWDDFDGGSLISCVAWKLQWCSSRHSSMRLCCLTVMHYFDKFHQKYGRGTQ